MHFFVPIAYAHESPLNVHADVSSKAKGLNHDLSLQPHQYFVNASSAGSAYLYRFT